MPTIEEAEEYTADGVEELLMEDNNDELTLRMDRYFLDEQIDDYTFKGSLKGTAFYKKARWDRNRLTYVYDVPDSMKFYKPVIIRFRDKKYKSFSITIGKEE
jgi:hypothetical protein